MNHLGKIFIIFNFPFKIFIFIVIQKLKFQILFLKIQNNKKDKLNNISMIRTSLLKINI